VAGIGNKDRSWWRYITGFDFISMSETWVDEKDWERWRESLPKSHNMGVRPGDKEQEEGKSEGRFYN